MREIWLLKKLKFFKKKRALALGLLHGSLECPVWVAKKKGVAIATGRSEGNIMIRGVGGDSGESEGRNVRLGVEGDRSVVR